MNTRRIAAIALSSRDFDSFEHRLDEACRWVLLAARMGAELAVLPEALNLWRGDGPGNPLALNALDVACEDWLAECRTLIDCACQARIAITVPIYEREGEGCVNCFHLVSAAGEVLGRYVKTHPTGGEMDEGVLPAEHNAPIEWDGVMVGGAICYDIEFPHVFVDQHRQGAQLFLCPSLTPGGDKLNFYCASLARPLVLAYPAWSRIIDILGRDVVAGGYRHETLRFGFGVPVYVADINLDAASFSFGPGRNQESIEAILRRYGSAVRLTFDQHNCRYSIEVVSPELSIDQVINEFDLVPIAGGIDGA